MTVLRRGGRGRLVLSLCALCAFGAAWKHGIPALAGEPAQYQPAQYENTEEDRRWRAYAADLASASGINVRYLPPHSLSGRKGDVLNHGGIGFLAIGAAEAPTVVVLPMSMLWRDSVASGYRDAGLPDPGKLAQEVVLRAASDSHPGATQGATAVNGARFASALRETAVLLPVSIRVASEMVDAALPSRRQQPRNFPARWAEGAKVDAAAAGAYPASHPRVRALVGWLTAAESCMTAVVLGDPCVGEKGLLRAPAGSFAAYCAEELRLPVVGASGAEEVLVAVSEASTDGARLRLSEHQWRRLGPRNWALEVNLEAEGCGAGAALCPTGPVMLQASWIHEGLSLTAVAAGKAAPDGTAEALELLPLRRNGVLIRPTGTEPMRLRLFFSEVEDPELSQLGKRRKGSAGRGRGGENSANVLPEVDLSASTPRSRPARLRTASQV